MYITPIIPGEHRYPTITPFTIADGQTYLNTLEQLVKMMKDIIDNVNESNEELYTLVVGVLNTKINEINDALDDQEASVDAKIETLETFVNDTDTELRTYIDNTDTELRNYVSNTDTELRADVADAVNQVINNSIELQDPVLSTIMGDDTSLTRIETDSLYSPETLHIIRADSFPGTDDEKAQSAVIKAQSLGGGTVLFSARDWVLTEPILFNGPVSFRGVSPTLGSAGTNLTYSGPAGTALFTYDVTESTADWFYRISFTDLLITGDGTDTYSDDATVDAIDITDDAGASYLNVAYVSFHRVSVRNVRRGISLDGYGHHLQECMVYSANIGYDFVHPEQVTMLNCWANYCDRGIVVNERRKPYGHVMHITGGAVQRCRTGIHMLNFYEPVIETYFELNSVRDVLFGDPNNSSNYTYGCKNITLLGNFAGTNPTEANIELFASTGATITFDSVGGIARDIPHVKANGFSNHIEVIHSAELTSSNPFVFNGDSAKTSWSHRRGIVGQPVQIDEITAENIVSQASNPINYRKVSGNRVAVSGVAAAEGATSGVLFTLPVGFRPTRVVAVPVSMYVYDTNVWQTTSIEVNTSGVVRWVTPLSSKINLHLDIEFQAGG